MTKTPERPGLRNAMTVDVEDYFQVHAFADIIDRDRWEHLPSRVERGTMRVLELFAGAGIEATFFVLGWVARRQPGLVKEIVAAGHEVASHGLEHRQVDRQGADNFRRDISEAKAILEDVSGREVLGFRAASFSMNEATPWAHGILKDVGYRYSSSIYPIRHDLYGQPDAPRFAYHPSGEEGVVEFPVSTIKALGRNLPCGGGGYFRLFPWHLTAWAVRRLNRNDGQPGIFYFHTWELDPDQPRPAGASLRSRFRHYVNLDRQPDKLRCMLFEFSWGRMDKVFGSHLSPQASEEPADHRAGGGG